jgi:penicillin-binding protein 1C
VNAYRTLANGGVWSPLRMLPEKSTGPSPRRLYSEATVFLVSSILADRESRSATFGLENPLATRFWTAVKTGTSKDMRDNWCVGYSRRYTVGVWVGNFSGKPMRHVSGITGAAPVWLDVMNRLHRDDMGAADPVPEPVPGVVTARTAPGRRPEWFLRGTEPRPLLARARSVPRIATPAGGTVIALDPDIPASRQRVVLEAAGASASARWVLEGTMIGSAGKLSMWSPHPGKHALSLIDREGRSLDTVRFEVRGAAPARLDRAGRAE